MTEMINFHLTFKLNQDKFGFPVENKIYYVELFDGEDIIVWWKEDGEWECNKEYTKTSFQNNVNEGIWIIQ